MVTFLKGSLKSWKKKSPSILLLLLRNRSLKSWLLKRLYLNKDLSLKGSSPAVMISCQVKIKRSRNVKKRNSWKNRGQAVRTLAPLLKRKAGNLDPQILTKTPRALPKKSSKLIKKYSKQSKKKKKSLL